MQIWYLTPFLLALLVWWVATRRHPEDKEKWTWMALGVCAGAILMFTLAFLSDHKSEDPKKESNVTAPMADAAPRATLQNDTAVEILGPTRTRENRAVTVGSLQITLLQVVGPTARFQIDPRYELAFVGGRQWTYTSPVDTPDPREPPPEARTLVERSAFEVTLGDHLEFGFRGRVYRLSLLELPRALLGFVPTDAEDAFASHAVIRLIDIGPYEIGGHSSENTIPPSKRAGNSESSRKR